LDPGLTFQATGSSSSCAAAGQVVTCTEPGGLVTGHDESFDVHVTVASTLNGGTVLSNSATVGVNTGATVDPNSANDTSNTTATTVVEDVKLAVKKTFDSASVTAGGAHQTFTIDVTNNGYSDADNISLTDSVDNRLIVDSIDPGDYTCATASQSISCTMGHLAGKTTKSITVHYHVDTTTDSANTVANSATAKSDEDTASGG